MPVCLGDFVVKARPISATAPLSHVVELFQNDGDAEYFILIRDKRPAGLISRSVAFEFAISAGVDNLPRLPIGDLITARAVVMKAETTVRVNETTRRRSSVRIAPRGNTQRRDWLTRHLLSLLDLLVPNPSSSGRELTVALSPE